MSITKENIEFKSLFVLCKLISQVLDDLQGESNQLKRTIYF